MYLPYDKISEHLYYGFIFVLLLLFPLNNLKFILLPFTAIVGMFIIRSKKITLLEISVNDILWLLFIGWAGLSSFWAINYSLVWYPLIGWLSYFLFFKIQSTLLNSENKALYIISAIFLITFLMHVYAVMVDLPFDKSWNYFFSKNMNYTPAYLLMLSPFVILANKEVYLSLIQRSNTIIGNISYFNLLVNLMAFGGTGYFLWHNQNRASLLAFASVLTIFFISTYWPKHVKSLLKIGLSILFLFTITYSIFPKSILNLPPAQLYFGVDSVRPGYIQQTIEKLGVTWPFGFGLGNWSISLFSSDISSFILKNYASSIDYSRNHNFFNQLIGDIGIIGFTLFTSILFIPLYKASTKYQSLSSFQKASFSSVIIYILCSLFYASVNFHNYHFSEINLLLMFSLGALSKDQPLSMFKLKKVKSIIGLLGIASIIWFAHSKITWDKYLAVEHAGSSLEKIKLYKEVYNKGYLTHIGKTPIALKIGEEYQAIDSTHSAHKWFDITLKDDPSSREALLYNGRLALRKLNNIDVAKDLAKKYYGIEKQNFDINLFLLELSLYDQDFNLTSDNMDAVIHGQYSLRKKILEYSLFYSSYLFSITNSENHIREAIKNHSDSLQNRRAELINYLPILERTFIDQEEKNRIDSITVSYIEEQERFLFFTLGKEEFMKYIIAKNKNGFDFRIKTLLNPHQLSMKERRSMEEILFNYRTNRSYTQLNRRYGQSAVITSTQPCDLLKEQIKNYHLSPESIAILKKVTGNCIP